MIQKPLLWALVAVVLAGIAGAGLAARSMWSAQSTSTGVHTLTITSFAQTATSTQTNSYILLSINGTSYYALKVSNSNELVKGIHFKGIFFKKLLVTTTGCIADVITVAFPDGYSKNLTAVYTCTSSPIPEWLEVVKHSGIEAGVYQKNGNLYLVERKLAGSEKPNAFREFLFELGNWSISINISNSKGSLTVEYVGSKPLKVSNPLLPLAAGLNIELYRSNPPTNTVIRKSGMYMYNKTVEIRPSTTDTVSFNAEGLRLIRVEGKILGKIPLRILIPLARICNESSTSYRTSVVSVVTVTVTRTVTAGKTTTSTQAGYCRFIKQGEYAESLRKKVSRVELGNETVISDGTLEVHVPLRVSEHKIPLIFEDQGKSPVLVNSGYVEYEVVNASEDGVHWRPVNVKLVYAVPTTTIPPLPPECQKNQPANTYITYEGSINLLMPGKRATLIALSIPGNVNALKGFKEYWAYLKGRIYYFPVKAIYRIETNIKEPYLSKFVAVSLYAEREIELQFKVHVNMGTLLGSG